MNKLLRLGLAVGLLGALLALVPMGLSAQGPTGTPAPSQTPGTIPVLRTTPVVTPTLGVTPTVSLVAAPTPTPLLTSQNIGDKLALSLFGFTERTLRGPFDTTSQSFSLPADWQVDVTRSQLQLTINVVFSGTGAPQRLTTGAPVSGAVPRGAGPSSGTLAVTLNSILVGTIYLDRDGERTVTIPLTPESLVPNARTGRYSLTISLNSAVDCDFDWHTTVVVRPTSQLVLPHQFVSPTTDLRQLPRPIYQNSFLQDKAYLIVPDKPTTTELQGALDIAVGFGRMSLGKLVLTLLPQSQLTPEIQKSENLIFVGQASNLAILNGLPLPASLTPNGFAVAGMTPEDGIVQIAVSPWNPLRVIMIVGGNQDSSVNKAAQALSTGVIKVTAQTDLALVSDVRADLAVAAFAVDRTLASLGYSNITLQDIGTNTAEFRFYVPSAQTVTSDAYFDLIFNHSALIEFDNSGILVTLNDEPIGSARFNDDTAKLGTVRIPIPKSSVRPGVNRLVVQADLFPRFVCVDPRFALLWLTIRSESLLHLPMVPLAENEVQRVVDLTAYPNLLTLHPTLSTTAFVLPQGDPAAWNTATQIASHLGFNSAVAMADLVVAFGDSVPDALRKSRDLLIVGRPSTMPFVAELKDVLPAPFEAGSDLATERNVRVVYRIPPGTAVGYLQLMVSPWSNEHVIMGVLGSTTQGLRWAGDALTISRLRGRLSGNYAFVNGEQIVIGDSRVGPTTAGVMQTAVPGGLGTPVAIGPTSTDVPVPDPRPSWMLPVMGGAIGLMVLVVLIVGISGLVNRLRGE